MDVYRKACLDTHHIKSRSGSATAAEDYAGATPVI